MKRQNGATGRSCAKLVIVEQQDQKERSGTDKNNARKPQQTPKNTKTKQHQSLTNRVKGETGWNRLRLSLPTTLPIVSWDRTRWEGVTAHTCRWQWMALFGEPTLSQRIFYSHWTVWGLDSSTMSPNRRVLLPVELSQRHPHEALLFDWKGGTELPWHWCKPKRSRILPDGKHSFSDPSADFQVMTVHASTAGRCCLYRAMVQFDPLIGWLSYALGCKTGWAIHLRWHPDDHKWWHIGVWVGVPSELAHCLGLLRGLEPSRRCALPYWGCCLACPVSSATHSLAPFLQNASFLLKRSVGGQLAVEVQQPASLSRQALHVDRVVLVWEHMIHKQLHTIEALTRWNASEGGYGRLHLCARGIYCSNHRPLNPVGILFTVHSGVSRGSQAP